MHIAIQYAARFHRSCSHIVGEETYANNLWKKHATGKGQVRNLRFVVNSVGGDKECQCMVEARKMLLDTCLR